MNELVKKPPAEGVLAVLEPVSELPPILAGHETPQQQRRVEQFYGDVARMFEAWLERSSSVHTQRTYRRAVMDFVEFMNIPWPKRLKDGTLDGPDESWRLLQATVQDVQKWRTAMDNDRQLAPLTLNHRVSSLAGFYKFMRESAAVMKLPINIPNPAHSQFISRETQEPVNPTEALSATRARQLMHLPEGEDALAYRDRAIIKFMLYGAARIRTACLLNVGDFIDDPENPRVKIQEKGSGKSKRTLGINPIAADALREYCAVAEITSGPMFRARRSRHSRDLSEKRIHVNTMYQLLTDYLRKLPGALVEERLADGTTRPRCLYTTHTLRATNATLLLDAGVDIRDVQKLLGHKSVTVTQTYDKRRKGTKDSASHQLVL